MPNSSGNDDAWGSGLPEQIYELFLILERGGDEGVLVRELPAHLRGADLLIVASRERPNPEWESATDASRRGVHATAPKTLRLTEFGRLDPGKGFQRFGLSPQHLHMRLQDDRSLRLRLTNAGRIELADWRLLQNGHCDRYADVLRFIEANGIQDDKGGFAVPLEFWSTWERLAGLTPMDEDGTEHRPRPSTPRYHAMLAWELSDGHEEQRYFPSEAMRHLRLAAGETQHPKALTPAMTDGQKRLEEPPDELVTLAQVAPLTGLRKRTLERYLQRGQIPQPDFRGGGGKSHKWCWSRLRPALEKVSSRVLPVRFPGSRII